MTTINNIEDFIRVLDEHPQWLEAARSRLLSRALLDLPEEFARFQAEVRRSAEAVNQRLSNLEESLANLSGEVRLFVAATDRRLSIVESDIGALKNQMGDIRGRIVYDIVRDEAPLLAGNMGFQFSAILHRGDLQRLTQSSDVSWMAPQDLQSFQRADLVIDAIDPSGEPHYIVVEISYTVNGYDTRRAIRNAGYLSRITGVPSTPAVAGVVLDHHIQDTVAAEAIFWYSIPMGDLRSD